MSEPIAGVLSWSKIILMKGSRGENMLSAWSLRGRPGWVYDWNVGIKFYLLGLVVVRLIKYKYLCPTGDNPSALLEPISLTGGLQ